MLMNKITIIIAFEPNSVIVMNYKNTVIIGISL